MVGMEERLDVCARTHQPCPYWHEQVPAGLYPRPLIANSEFIALVGFKDDAHRQFTLPITRAQAAPPERTDYHQALGWWKILRRFSSIFLSHSVPSSKKPRNGEYRAFHFLFFFLVRRQERAAVLTGSALRNSSSAA